MPNPRPDDKRGSRYNKWYRLPRYMCCVACGTVLDVTEEFNVYVMGRHAADCYPKHRHDWGGFEAADG